MTQLRKDAPGSAPGYTWDGPDDVVDVPPDLAHELLGQPDGGFHEVFDTDTDAGAAAAEAAAREAAERAAQEAADAEAARVEAQRAAEADRQASLAAAAAAAVEDEDEKLPTHKADLVKLADDLGVDSSGTAKEIAARITAHREAAKTVDGGDRTPVTEPDPDAH